MTSNILTRTALIAAVSGLALTMTACGSSDSSTSASGTSSSSSSAAAATTSSSAAATTGATDTAAENFGPGCSAVPTDGPGSFQGMSTAPVATAASANPVLSTLVQAVTAAGLVDTLNGLPSATVLAPANPAFAAIPADALQKTLADVPTLTKVLTHHVIPKRLSPAELAGTQTTANGDTVTITGSGTNFTISADQTLLGTAPANVICGNVQTANATVYIIDQVLKPTA